jgi:hypothetical protein
MSILPNAMSAAQNWMAAAAIPAKLIRLKEFMMVLAIM